MRLDLFQKIFRPKEFGVTVQFCGGDSRTYDYKCTIPCEVGDKLRVIVPGNIEKSVKVMKIADKPSSKATKYILRKA